MSTVDIATPCKELRGLTTQGARASSLLSVKADVQVGGGKAGTQQEKSKQFGVQVMTEVESRATAR